MPEQDALADLLASGAYERHVRSVRRKNSERRPVLLQALKGNLGPSVAVARADTGLHVVIWTDGIAADTSPRSSPTHEQPGSALSRVTSSRPTKPRPAAAGFILGYAGLVADALRRGPAVLASVLAQHR